MTEEQKKTKPEPHSVLPDVTPPVLPPQPGLASPP
jgi:hypothetical protein